jgi:hypothetical protein
MPQAAGQPGHADARARARGAAKLRDSAPDWAPAFLAAFRQTGMITAACAVAGVGRSTAYRRRHADEGFALALSDAEEEVTERIEREAFRRAVEGVERPVSIAGEREVIREYSDTLLLALLRARKPEVWSERHRLEHAGRVEHEHAMYDPASVELSAELRARVRRLLDGEDDDQWSG